MPALSSSPIPHALAQLGPLDTDAVADLRPYLDTVPDPRSPRGRWYSLTCILLICAAICGAKSIDELAKWGQRAHQMTLRTIGIRFHPLAWRRTPSAPTIDRVLTCIDGHALDTAIGAYLTHRHQAATTTDGTDTADPPVPRLPAIAVDGKAPKGSARLDRRCRHLLSVLTHRVPITLAQVEAGAKSNETRRFRPLLHGLDLAGHVVTFDALHTVKDHLAWLVKTKKAHYIAVIKTNQPTAHQQISTLPWTDVPIAHSLSETGHGRTESRPIKVLAVADSLSGIALPHAKLAIRVHRRRQPRGEKQTRETVYALTSLDAHQACPAELAAYLRGQWRIENCSHHIRDVTFGEDASTVHTGSAPRAMAALRNLANGVLKTLGAGNIAKTTRAIRDLPERALPLFGVSYEPDPSGT